MSGHAEGGGRAFSAILKEWVIDKKVPVGLGFSRALGTGLLMMLMVQAATGMLLSLCYAPTPDHAYDSVRFIDEDVVGGAWVRGLHHFGSSAVVVLVVAHMLRVFLTAAYKRPRQSLWLVGLGIFLVILGFGFTGYLLPWDQKGYWATDVGLSIAETVPVVGAFSADLLRGGPEVGALTLTRLYALHVILLPAVLAALVAIHLFLVHRLGITPPGQPVGQEDVERAPFFPDHVLREVMVGVGAIAAVAVLTAVMGGAPLEAPASRDAAGYDPRPEWYFLGLFQLLKYFEGDALVFGTVVLPGALFTALVLLPFTDRNPSRRLGDRPLALSSAVLVVGGVVVLTVLGLMDPGSKTEPPERVLEWDDPYEPPPSPPFQAPEGLPPDPLPPGRELVDSYECLYCHTLEGEGDEMGAGGPALEEAGAGRSAEWLHGLLLDPASVHPDTEMPSAEDLEMTDSDRDLIVQYLLEIAR